ncbi:Ig-like domain-containing protein [Bordetella trematum]|uniref:Ig-like domain-containing protein n=1 Tax=Bordetella trematum TaxID=123899 RepID=UPI00398920A3
MNKKLYRVVWSLARRAWVVADERARNSRSARGSRVRGSRGRDAVAIAVGGSLVTQALLPLSALAQEAPTVPVAAQQGRDSGWSRRLAGQVESLARAQAEGRRDGQLNADYLKREAQAQVNASLQRGVQAVKDSGLPFLRNLQGGLSHDFHTGRSALQLDTIDEVYRAGPNTGLLQLGAHNQNDRPTANAGLVYRRDVNEALMLGANAFLDYEFGKQHLRGSVGIEAIAPEFTLYGNVYVPMSQWRGAKRDGRRQERPASGMDIGGRYQPSVAPGLSLKAAYFRWNGANIDYFDTGRVQDRASGFKYGLEYRPVPLVSLGLEQTKVVGGERQTRVQLGLFIHFSEPLSKQLRRGASGAPAFSLDNPRHALVERENRIVLNTRHKEITLPLSLSLVSTHPVDGRVTVTGLTQPRATVSLRMPDGSSGSVTADGAGRFSYTSQHDQPSGAVVLGAANTRGDRSRELTYPYVDEVTLGDLRVVVMTKAVNPVDHSVILDGNTEPMMEVRVVFPGGEAMSVRADDKGNFRVGSRKRVSEGRIMVQAIDPETHKEARTVVEHVPPAIVAPTIDEVTTDAGTGRVTVTGLAEPGSEVELRFTDHSRVRVPVGDDGHYRVTSAGDIPSGELQAVRVPKADEGEVASRHLYKDNHDKTPPGTPVIATLTTSPHDGRLTVAGSAEPGAEVTVTFPDGTTKTVRADADGTYTATSDGDVPSGTIIANATDASGNTSGKASREYADDVDRTPPAVTISGTATHADTGRVTVTGMAEPDARVLVRFPDGTEKMGRAEADGSYTVTSDHDIPSGMIAAQAQDTAGNKSPQAFRRYTDEADKSAPEPPAITTLTASEDDGRLTVAGTAEAGAEVTVTFPDDTTTTVRADGDGRYVATSARDVPSGMVRASATDAAGNTSDEATRQYTDTVDRTPPAITITGTTADAATGRVTVSGTTEADADVTITFPDGTRKTAKADGEGRFTLTSDGNMPSGDIKAKSRDKAGNESPPITQAYIDTTAPAVSIIAATADPATGKVTVTGASEAGARIALRFPDGQTITVTADAGGNYSAASPRDVTASGNITAIATDASGNHSPQASKAYTDDVDKTAPEGVVITSARADASGRVTVAGTAEPHSTVTIAWPGGETKTTMAGTDGSYTASSARPVPSGDITATATDKSGNTGPVATHAYTDETAPPAPTFTTVDTDDTTGVVTVTGKAEPGSMVTVTLPGGASKTVPADATSGVFTATSDGDVPAGIFRASTRDAAGNVSPEASRDYADTVDKTPPATPLITTLTPDTTHGRLTVTGTAEPGSTVTVTFPDGTSKRVSASDAGEYHATSERDVPSGQVKASSVDAAGNMSPEASKDYVDTVDRTAPDMPVISTVTTDKTTGQVTVTGAAEPRSTVTVTFPDGTEKTVTATEGGAYTATSENDVSSGAIKASATDAQGNKSPETTRGYIDAVDKVAPVVTITELATAAETGRVTVTGHTEPEAAVRVTFPDGSHKNTTAGRDGSYSATSDADIASGEIRAQATDAAGNASAEVTRRYDDSVDKTAPDAPVITGVATDSSSGRVTVTGRAEPGAEVTITFPDGSTKTGTADATNGAFTATSDGDVPTGEIKARATDAARNESPQASRHYEDEVVDLRPPAAPTISSMTTDARNGHVTVQGTADPGVEVKVTFPGDTEVRVTADSSGNYRASSGKDIAGGQVKAVALRGTLSSDEVAGTYTDTWLPPLPKGAFTSVLETDRWYLMYLTKQAGTGFTAQVGSVNLAYASNPESVSVSVEPRNASDTAAVTVADFLRPLVTKKILYDRRTGENALFIGFQDRGGWETKPYRAIPAGIYEDRILVKITTPTGTASVLLGFSISDG